MILYSMTFSVEIEAHQDWLNDLKSTHIPSILLSGLINEYKILRMLNEHPDGGITFNCQLFMNDMTDLQTFEQDFEYNFLLSMEKKFAGKFIPFKTILEVVD